MNKEEQAAIIFAYNEAYYSYRKFKRSRSKRNHTDHEKQIILKIYKRNLLNLQKIIIQDLKMNVTFTKL